MSGARKRPARSRAKRSDAQPQGEAKPSGPKLVRREDVAAAMMPPVTPATIHKWVAQGCPVARRGSRGHGHLYDLEAVKRWKEERDLAAEGTLSVDGERAKLHRVQAEKIEMENAVRRRQLVERKQVTEEGRAVVAATRSRFLQVPRQAVQLGVCMRESEGDLKQLVVEALRDMTKWMPDELDRPLLEKLITFLEDLRGSMRKADPKQVQVAELLDSLAAIQQTADLPVA